LETVSPDLRKNLDKLQAERGLDIRRDFAAPLGGEFAFAIDGPILPTPSWKMVFEVNDPQHLQQTLERVVTEVNKEAARFGKAGLIWDRAEISGRTYYTLKSADFGLEVNMTYVNGYMIAGPSRAMVERAVRSQEAGYSLLSLGGLRQDCLLTGMLTSRRSSITISVHSCSRLQTGLRVPRTTCRRNKRRQSRRWLLTCRRPWPTAYAKGDSITFAANTDGGPFGLSPASLLGMPNALEIQHILSKGMGKN
jgi:hypothetical protein